MIDNLKHFKGSYFNEMIRILIRISLKFIASGPINDD